ncbi:hypothetical protein PARHAE_03278 [Paracoccus haematequi]|uniref:Uncharacterized protein n=1 Tax=Paracoccus haematequi TaxID=2491866 RepID=A0A3S4ETR1_9RHOB|nr:hypothetical protein [Paracoccus haematequi]VDS10067.1 hypothetical protein PARHAE_03278 [Paracoccus haematequi]
MKLEKFNDRERFELSVSASRTHFRRRGIMRNFRLTGREVDELMALTDGMTTDELSRVQVRSRAVREEVLKLYCRFDEYGLKSHNIMGISRDKANRWLRELEDEAEA